MISYNNYRRMIFAYRVAVVFLLMHISGRTEYAFEIAFFSMK